MALDLYLEAEHFDPDALIQAVDEVQGRGWKSLCSGGRAVTLLACPPYPSMAGPVASVHERLERLGVVCIAGRPSCDRLRLNGGSASACQLQLGPFPSVVKRVGASVMGDFDARDRHSREARWTAQINAIQPTLFPRILSIREGQEVVVRSEFFPAYTLGELLLQGRFDGPAALCLLRKILKTINSQLSYKHASDAGEPYLVKVRRRLELMMKTNTSPLMRHLCQSVATIDGTLCPSAFDIISQIENDSRLKRLVTCSEPRQCHGDLIPEDIIYSGGIDEFRLIDPNPQVKDPVADIAKLVMSLSLRYELALRDQVEVRYTDVMASYHVETRVVAGHYSYTSACNWLLDALLADAKVLIGGVAESHRLQRNSILLMAGLQAMAIASFHLLHHRRHERAAYFLARGLRMTKAAIDQSIALE